MPATSFSSVYLVCISDFYYSNRIFDIASPQNRDNAYYPFYLLKERFKERQIALNTYDFLDEKVIKRKDFALLFSEIPSNFSDFIDKYPDVPMYLLINESEVVIPRNWNLDLHKKFVKIFCWHDDFIDNQKYIKTNFSSKFPAIIPKDIGHKKKLCTLIAFNKKSNHPLELYSKRLEAIRWFEENHPEDFDFYGIGWDVYIFNGLLIVRMLNRLHFIRRMLAPHYQTYGGPIERKFDVLKRYKFSICYENVRDIPGWVTEKIFDCFFAGCVPVYWGAANVTEHVPEDCFIDRRKFKSYEELYAFMTSMTDSAYGGYLERIEAYLKGPQAYQYTAEYFAETIVNGMMHG